MAKNTWKVLNCDLSHAVIKCSPVANQTGLCDNFMDLFFFLNYSIMIKTAHISYSEPNAGKQNENSQQKFHCLRFIT